MCSKLRNIQRISSIEFQSLESAESQACYEAILSGDLSRPPSMTLITTLPPLIPREAPPQLAPLLNLMISSSP
ncbi:hypothetical protein Tco_0343375 [Tanacetum coccineum]